MQNNLIFKLIATSGGVGYMPFAPGTFGALVGLLICWIAMLCHVDTLSFQPFLILMILATYWLGIISSHKLIGEWGDDPGKIVIDETCGFLITMLFVTPNPFNLIVGFVLFRFFDIVKPFGIRKIELLKNKSHAIMLDDVLAGLASCVVLHLVIIIKNYLL